MLKDKIKGFVVGVICTTLLASCITVFASAIEVEFIPLKYFFDGVQKSPASDQQGFIYNGRTYVPLRFMSEALGKEVSWDASTSSIYVGLKPSGKITYLEELTTLSKQSYDWKFGVTATTNTGTQYLHSFVCDGSWNNYMDVKYAINGKYKRFQAKIASLEGWNTRGLTSNDIGTIKIYADDKLVYDSGITKSDSITMKEVDIDITGVALLRIKKDEQQYSSLSGYLGLCDAKLID